MKILHILDHSLPLHSGYTFRSQSIFREQINRGLQLAVVTSPKHEQSWKKPCGDMEVVNGIRYYRSGNHKGVSGVSELKIMHLLKKKIKRVIEQEKPDILHVHSPVLNFFPALWESWQAGLPIIYDIRAFWEDAAVDHGTYSEGSPKYQLVRFLETMACRSAAQVAVLCEGLKGDLTKRGIPGKKLHVVYNGVNPVDFESHNSGEEFKKRWALENKLVIGFIGSFYRYEGLDSLIEAFCRIAGQREDVVLLLVGGGEMEKELKAQVEACGIEDRTLMPGRIPHEKIPGVYELYDILIYPRHKMRLTDLVTPLKPLETMAMGKTFIASDVGGHLELIRDGLNGLLFKSGDVSGLSEKISRLLSDSALRQKLGNQARKWVREHHTWTKTTAVYQDIYAAAFRKKRN